jgi:hypothetical protein
VVENWFCLRALQRYLSCFRSATWSSDSVLKTLLEVPPVVIGLGGNLIIAIVEHIDLLSCYVVNQCLMLLLLLLGLLLRCVGDLLLNQVIFVCVLDLVLDEV